MRPAFSLGLLVAGALAACSTSPNGPGANTPDDAGSGSHPDAAGAADASVHVDSGVAHDGGAVDASHPQDASVPGQDATVTTFNKTLFAFGSKTVPTAARRQTVAATFPSSGTFQKINLHVALDCPSEGCDHWDRVGSLGIVTQAPVDGGAHGSVVEIARFATPFCSTAAWDFDVTDLAPLLSGNATLQGFIDTWVPQGNPSAYGGGWLLSATFTFTGGTPAKVPIANVPMWTWAADNDPPSYQYGDPNDPIGNHITAQTPTLTPGASSYALRTIITGHGQGNADNCAEFCQATHTITVGSTPFTYAPMRDCSTTPNGSSQCGTWTFSRAGWCPGASVDPWVADVSAGVGSGSTVSVSYASDGYENTCRPDLPSSAKCNTSLCVQNPRPQNCAYDGQGHTTPIFYVSSLLVAYQ